MVALEVASLHFSSNYSVILSLAFSILNFSILSYFYSPLVYPINPPSVLQTNIRFCLAYIGLSLLYLFFLSLVFLPHRSYLLDFMFICFLFLFII